MIRVGIVAGMSGGWTGGRNYLRNLIATVLDLPERRIEPVLIVPPDADAAELQDFGTCDIVRTRLVGADRRVRAVRRLLERAGGRDLLFERFLRRHRIDVLSHSGHLGPRAALPSIAWLPDFQHLHLPHFFSPKDLAIRDRGYRRTASAATTILLSSHDALNSLAQFAPDAVARARILPFVAGLVDGADQGDAARLATEYGIDRPFFFLPNQFWQHKNHEQVIDALALLVATGRAPLVVMTGNTLDGRAPDHFDRLMAKAEAGGAAPFMKVLGLVPYDDLGRLMRRAAAIINPSRFEGWSTTVEEAKSLGKRIILSDIPVHREQAPGRAHFVSPDDPAGLAAAIEESLATWSPEEDVTAMEEARRLLPARKRAFGELFQTIVEDAAGRRPTHQ